nr:unnamed protein product [Callosobruchus analis]
MVLKFDDIDQKGRCNSLRIFNLKEMKVKIFPTRLLSSSTRNWALRLKTGASLLALELVKTG